MTVEELLKERWTAEAEAIAPDVDEAWRRIERRVGAAGRGWRQRGVAAVAAGVIALGAAVGIVRLGEPDEGSLADAPGALQGRIIPGALWPTFDLEDLIDLERAVDADPAARWMIDPEEVARRYLSTHLGLQVRTLTVAPGRAAFRYETASSSGTLDMGRMPWGRVWFVQVQRDDAIDVQYGTGGGLDTTEIYLHVTPKVSGTIETSVRVHTPKSVSITDSDRRRIPARSSKIDLVAKLDHGFHVGIVRVRFIPDSGRREVVAEYRAASQGLFDFGASIPPAFARAAEIADAPGQIALTASESLLQPGYGCGRVTKVRISCAPAASPLRYEVEDDRVAVFIAPGDATRVQLRAPSGDQLDVVVTRPDGFARSYGAIELPAGFDPTEAIAFAADGREVARTAGPAPDDGS